MNGITQGLGLFQAQFLMVWFFTFALVMIFDRIALHRLGAKSAEWKRLRAARNLSLKILTLPVLVILLLMVFGRLAFLVNSGRAAYIMLPYFIVVAYFPTKVFRELKRRRKTEHTK